MDEQQVNVVVDNDVLSIRGERPDHREGEKRSYREAGIPYGAFGADVFIPFPVDADDADAEYAQRVSSHRLAQIERPDHRAHGGPTSRTAARREQEQAR